MRHGRILDGDGTCLRIKAWRLSLEIIQVYYSRVAWIGYITNYRHFHEVTNHPPSFSLNSRNLAPLTE